MEEEWVDEEEVMMRSRRTKRGECSWRWMMRSRRTRRGECSWR